MDLLEESQWEGYGIGLCCSSALALSPSHQAAHFLARRLSFIQHSRSTSLAPFSSAHLLVMLQQSYWELKPPNRHVCITVLVSSLGNLPSTILVENWGKDVAACHPLLSDKTVYSCTAVSRNAIKWKFKKKKSLCKNYGEEYAFCLQNPELIPLLYDDIDLVLYILLFLVSASPLPLFLSLAQTPPTHSSFGLMGHKVSPKCETLRASAGHPTRPKNLEASSFY